MPLMGEGAKWKLFIPSALGYPRGIEGKIPIGSALVFEIEVVDIDYLDDAVVLNKIWQAEKQVRKL